MLKTSKGVQVQCFWGIKTPLYSENFGQILNGALFYTTYGNGKSQKLIHNYYKVRIYAFDLVL